MSKDRWKVGQTVVVNGVNMRKPMTGTVTKVGRKLVTVKDAWGEAQFRIDTGVINDNYGHSHILTEEEHADKVRRAALVSQLSERGINLNYRVKPLPTDTLAAVLAVLVGEESHSALPPEFLQ